MNQQHSFLRVTIYFGLFATIAAGLIGLGKESWNLPVLVGFCAIVSIVYTDVLGWFSLHRWLVYVAMIAGAGIATMEQKPTKTGKFQDSLPSPINPAAIVANNPK